MKEEPIGALGGRLNSVARSRQAYRGACRVESVGTLFLQLRFAWWVVALCAPLLPVVVQAQTTHECIVHDGVVVDGVFLLDADTAPAQRKFDVGSDLASDTRIAATIEEANGRWPDGWAMRTVYDDGGQPVNGVVLGIGWALRCFNPPVTATPPPPAPPPPPPSVRQSVEVALGTSGETLTLRTTEAGGWTLNGRAFTSGTDVTAKTNGSTYTLTLDGTTWSAAYKMPDAVSLALGTTGGSISVLRLEDGSYYANGSWIASGTVVTAENGNMYTVTISDGGAFTAEYVVPPALSVPLGTSGSSVDIVRNEDGSFSLAEGGEVITAETRMTAANGNVYAAVFSPDGIPVGVMQVLAQSSTLEGTDAATVTLTNLTPGQVMSPVIVIVHGKDAVPVFTPGERASSALAMLAEDNQASALIGAARSDPHVEQAEVLLGLGPNGMIGPGESASLGIAVRSGFDQITVVASLMSTNDAFVGASGIAVPESGVIDQFLPAWDAGSEANDEDCDHIPGPPCGNNVNGVREDVPIVAHGGVHGQGDLDPSTFDWNYPAARITVELAGSQ